MSRPVTSNDQASWLAAIWDVLEQVSLPVKQYDDVCTAMAWIAEELEVSAEQIADAQDAK